MFTGGCRIYAQNAPAHDWTLQSTAANLFGVGDTQRVQRTWLKFEMDIPNNYTCGGCWWKMNYAYPSAMNDTTTWRAYIVGNPIHLVPSP